MRITLTMHLRGSFLDDTPTRYDVGSLPTGHKAWIANFSAPNKRDGWRILRYRDKVQSDWTGSYKSAEEALAVLQEEYDGVAVLR